MSISKSVYCHCLSDMDAVGSDVVVYCVNVQIPVRAA
jgi:hypothetical protein